MALPAFIERYASARYDENTKNLVGVGVGVESDVTILWLSTQTFSQGIAFDMNVKARSFPWQKTRDFHTKCGAK